MLTGYVIGTWETVAPGTVTVFGENHEENLHCTVLPKFTLEESKLEEFIELFEAAVKTFSHVPLTFQEYKTFYSELLDEDIRVALLKHSDDLTSINSALTRILDDLAGNLVHDRPWAPHVSFWDSKEPLTIRSLSLSIHSDENVIEIAHTVALRESC